MPCYVRYCVETYKVCHFEIAFALLKDMHALHTYYFVCIYALLDFSCGVMTQTYSSYLKTRM
jgi:hypothetical protein